jgi:hypothetical protein
VLKQLIRILCTYPGSTVPKTPHINATLETFTVLNRFILEDLGNFRRHFVQLEGKRTSDGEKDAAIVGASLVGSFALVLGGVVESHILQRQRKRFVAGRHIHVLRLFGNLFLVFNLKLILS